MKRRDFLKLLGACVVAPGTVVTAVKMGPKQRWPTYYLTCPSWEKEKLLEKFRRAFKTTQFQRPLYLRSRKAYTGQYFDQTPD